MRKAIARITLHDATTFSGAQFHFYRTDTNGNYTAAHAYQPTDHSLQRFINATRWAVFCHGTHRPHSDGLGWGIHRIQS